jgi:hypothetical protein
VKPNWQNSRQKMGRTMVVVKVIITGMSMIIHMTIIHMIISRTITTTVILMDIAIHMGTAILTVIPIIICTLNRTTKAMGSIITNADFSVVISAAFK